MRRTRSLLATVAIATASVGGVLVGSTLVSGAAGPTLAVPRSPLSKGPATAVLNFAGSPGLAGRARATSISCDEPSLSGTAIFLLASPRATAVGLNIELAAGRIRVTVSTGSGTAFRARVFTGTGVTAFNPAVGAKLNGALTEIRYAPAQNKGSLGAVTSVKGSVNCGNQGRGTSTITFSGGTAEGTVDGRLHPVRVVCNASTLYGNSVQVQGIIKVGSKGRALLLVTFTKTGLAVFESFAPTAKLPAVQHFYSSSGTVHITLTKGGVTVDGSVKETASPGVAAHTLHLVGKAACGTFTGV